MNWKRLISLVAVAAMLTGIALVVYAQGGPKGPAAAPQGVPCPYGGVGGPQGWWTRVKGQTPEQQKFVDGVVKLHEQIRARQIELRSLQASGASAADISAKQSQIDALRKQHQETMTRNAGICRQLGVAPCPGPGYGPGYRCPAGGCDTGRGLGGWWNRVTPQTADQTAFVNEVKSLHDQIFAAQAAGDQAKVTSLRAKLHEVMVANQALHQQMMMSSAGPRGRGMGGGRGMGRGWGTGRQ